MAKKEINTDLWVNDLLKEAGIKLTAQGSDILEIDNALKTASKKGTGKVGFPEYCGVVKDFVIVIEDKANVERQVKLDDNSILDMDVKSITDYALNGAYFYTKHILDNTNYKKAIAFGISGDEKNHIIKPIYLDGREYFMDLPEVESFISFNEDNIDEYYIREILKEDTDEEKTTEEIINDAKELHEYLRNYGNLSDKDKPLVVSGILLALREMDYKNFSVNDLIGDSVTTDGMKIYNAIKDNLQRSQVSPETKKDKLLSQFSIIKDTVVLNEVNQVLGKTPLKFYTEFLCEKLYKTIRYNRTEEDYLGRFYGEFMSYSGGDGQSLGIVLTPKHVCTLFCDLVNLKPEDVVLDPCCGTAGFLVSAMHNMISKTKDAEKIRKIKREQLHGYELQPYMFTIATTNMILRGDGKSNLICDDFLAQDSNRLQLKGATVGMMNPPYSMGKVSPEKCELSFVEHLLDSLAVDARCIVIVPQSAMTGKNNYEKSIKERIYKKHTLEGVITLNTNTFYSVGTNPCIAIFTAHVPHTKNKECKFINFENDGFEVQKHKGLVETESARDKKQHLLDVWNDKIETTTKFCVKTTIEPNDEWLHSFYYFNDEIPTDGEFEKTISDYLTFEFSMVMQNKEYLFKDGKNDESK
jgi:restriction enzyme, alpha subunit/N-6 DNA methylase